MYGDVVLGVDHHHFEEMLELHKEDRGVDLDTELTAEDLEEAGRGLQGQGRGGAGPALPGGSRWSSSGAPSAPSSAAGARPRAMIYRRSTTSPRTGARPSTCRRWSSATWATTAPPAWPSPAIRRPARTSFYGEFLINAQGEDVVAGIRTPQSLTKVGENDRRGQLPADGRGDARAFAELERHRRKLETHYRDMQDIEFTIQRRQALSCCRPAPASARPRRRSDRRRDGGRGADHQREAVSRVDPGSLDQLLHPTLDPRPAQDHRRAACRPRRARGRRSRLHRRRGRRPRRQGEKVILVRVETCPEDIHGMQAAAGILTARGGMTSHAAVVARGMGSPASPAPAIARRSTSTSAS